jgi:DNA-binding transcriptional ArsR family regulator
MRSNTPPTFCLSEHSDLVAAAELLSAMSNASRLEILRMTSEKEWCVSDLAEKIRISQSALSQHLKRLRDAKIVQTRRDGHNIYYRCASSAVSKMLVTLDQIYDDELLMSSKV